MTARHVDPCVVEVVEVVDVVVVEVVVVEVIVVDPQWFQRGCRVCRQSLSCERALKQLAINCEGAVENNN